MRTKGFTLAEVLLTLAIIGVVASLTIPAVITKVQQDQYVVGVKKAYNTLKSVEREAVQENGPIADWEWTGTEADFNKYYKPHFDILKDCGVTTDDGCLVSQHYNIHGNNFLNYNTDLYYKFITSDGVAYMYRTDSQAYPGRVAVFTVDVNGKKKPNQLGRDTFGFFIFPDYGIQPSGKYDPITSAKLSSSDIEEGCNGPSGLGGNCTIKVLAEGAMNY